jgi:hypothetical protein
MYKRIGNHQIKIISNIQPQLVILKRLSKKSINDVVKGKIKVSNEDSIRHLSEYQIQGFKI